MPESQHPDDSDVMPQRKRMKLSELLELMKDDKNKEAITKQLAAIPVGRALADAELKELRVKDVARDKLMEDFADNTTASWRRSIKVSKLSSIGIMIESNLFGGIIHAPRRETVLPTGLILLIAGIVVLAATLFYLQPIELWVKTVLLPDPTEQFIVGAVIGVAVILALYLWNKSRKSKQ